MSAYHGTGDEGATREAGFGISHFILLATRWKEVRITKEGEE
jgi:hypothetical protein